LQAWRGTPEQLEQARAGFVTRLDADVGSFGYRLARIDIDNDGSPDDLFYLDHNAGKILLALNTDQTTIDVETTERILKHPSRRSAGWGYTRPAFPDEALQGVTRVSDAYISVQYNVLVYNGKFYVDLAWRVYPEYSVNGWNERATSRLCFTAGEQSEEICEYGRLPKP
jgi:hypothetical protein